MEIAISPDKVIFLINRESMTNSEKDIVIKGNNLRPPTNVTTIIST